MALTDAVVFLSFCFFCFGGRLCLCPEGEEEAGDEEQLDVCEAAACEASAGVVHRADGPVA